MSDKRQRIRDEFEQAMLWLTLRTEQDADTAAVEKKMLATIGRFHRSLEKMPTPRKHMRMEPNSLKTIRAMRPQGPRRLELPYGVKELENRLLGAWLGRAAGCILGIPCEGQTRNELRNSCVGLGMDFPLNDYWRIDARPVWADSLHYWTTHRKYFLKPNLSFIGSDDDIIYTVLGLLILEEYGPDFTSEQVVQAWLKYLPYACTAEKAALENARRGLAPPKTAEANNPYSDWIGADIRSDPWAYAAPGWMQKAAEFAYRDARVSHQHTGLHGAMFVSAAISAAFAVTDPVHALELGLTEIPRGCRTALTVRETLAWCRRDRNWEKTMDRIEKRYAGLSGVHTLNNLAIVVAGICYGKGGFEKTISLTVSGGLDTDCTGATAGSLVGATRGASRLPSKWIRPLGNKVETYLKGKPYFTSTGLAERFARIAVRVLAEKE